MATGLRHVILLVVVLVAPVSSQSNGNTYEVMKDASGVAVCSTDPPETVIAMGMADMAFQCGVRCTRELICYYYQFKADTMQCELYTMMPGNFTATDNCVGHKFLYTSE